MSKPCKHEMMERHEYYGEKWWQCTNGCDFVFAPGIWTDEEGKTATACQSAFDAGIESVLSIRCKEHYTTKQLNTTESNKGECGVCAYKSGFKDALEWVKKLRDEKISLDTIIKGLELRLTALFLPRQPRS